jgi:hypothetical protein
MEIQMSHWMKVEFTTPDKPEMIAAARMCKASAGDTFLAFFRLWSYFDNQTATGFLPDLTTDDLDRIAGLSGFGKAMAKVGWIEQDTRGITIPHWEKHNGSSAKRRALTQSRVQKCRAAKQWVTHR